MASRREQPSDRPDPLPTAGHSLPHRSAANRWEQPSSLEGRPTAHHSRPAGIAGRARPQPLLLWITDGVVPTRLACTAGGPLPPQHGSVTGSLRPPRRQGPSPKPAPPGSRAVMAPAHSRLAGTAGSPHDGVSPSIRGSIGSCCPDGAGRSRPRLGTLAAIRRPWPRPSWRQPCGPLGTGGRQKGPGHLPLDPGRDRALQA